MKEIEKLMFALKHIGMFVSDEQDIYSVITFVGGYDYAYDYSILKGFREWLVTEYFENGNPFGWPFLLQVLLEDEKSYQDKIQKLSKILLDFFENEKN